MFVVNKPEFIKLNVCNYFVFYGISAQFITKDPVEFLPPSRKGILC